MAGAFEGCFGGFSDSVAAIEAPLEAFPQSNAEPGVLGVLVADPKEANAPEPRPKAEDFPGVAEAFVFTGVMPLDTDGRPETTSPDEDRRDLASGRPELSLDRSVLCLEPSQRRFRAARAVYYGL